MADLEPRIAPSGVWLAPPPAYDKIHGWEYMAHPLMFAYDPYLAAMLVPLFRERLGAPCDTGRTKAELERVRTRRALL